MIQTTGLTAAKYVYILLLMNNDPDLQARCFQIGADCTCFNLRKATRVVSALFDSFFSSLGIRGTQFSLMCALYAKDSVAMNPLADILAMDRTTLSRNLKLLEADGLAAQVAGSDRRTRYWALTEKGRDVFYQAVPLWEKAQQAVTEQLGAETVQRLNALLKQTVQTV